MTSSFPNQNNYPGSFISTKRNQQVYSGVRYNLMFSQDNTDCEQSQLFIHRAAMLNFLACEVFCFTSLFEITVPSSNMAV